MQRILELLARLPSTNTRIVVTLGCVVATTAVYLWTARDADPVWVAFLAAMSGLDVAQFGAKRMTHKPQPLPEIELPPPETKP